MSFEIRVNSEPFELWETATVRRSIDTNAGAFQFTSTARQGIKDYPVRAGDKVQILINGIPKVTGFVDRVGVAQDANQTSGSHSVSVSGRDTTQDLIDSSVPDAAKSFNGPISLVTICENLINALGANIPVVDDTGGVDLQFGSSDQFTSDSGRNAMQFLVNFARKKQVYLITDGAGRLVIFRPGGTSATTPLQHTAKGTDNVKRYRAQYNQQNRFNSYKVRSQPNFGFDDLAEYDTEEGVNVQGDSTDPEIRASRFLEVQGEESMMEPQTGNRAEEENNIRRALSSIYEATVQGVTQESGELWDIGLAVKVDDPFAGFRGNFLIKEVEYTVTLTGGTSTLITCVPPDAYTVRGEPTATDKRRASIGERFQVTDGATTETFTR